MDIGPLLRSHVERCLQDEFDLCRVVADDDGDYPLERKGITYYVGLHETDGAWWVKVFCPLVIGVKRSAKLLAELNDLNARTPLTKAVWQHGTVFIGGHLHSSALTRETLGRLCRAVGGVAADVGEMIAVVHGGELVRSCSCDEETA